MATPEMPQKSPFPIELKPGKYYWCACGISKNQPFCDGSHKGTEFVPVELEVTEPKKVYLCGCKQTNTPGFCDGSHKNL
ncbi:MAG: CDGSH iron-sulfur domain-containing protein [Candidatus Kapaibacterium sp.]